MKPNVYTDLINTMRNEGSKYNPPLIEVGNVVNTEPVQIKVGDLILEQQNFLIAHDLINNYTREGVITQKTPYAITGELSSMTESISGGSGESSFASHAHAIKIESTIDVTSDTVSECEIVLNLALSIGDMVVLYKLNNSKYAILNKVVQL